MIAAPPSRADMEDADFNTDLVGRIVIHLDGVRQTAATAYDVGAGTVTRCRADADGKFMLTDDGEGIVMETVTGAVEVSWLD